MSPERPSEEGVTQLAVEHVSVAYGEGSTARQALDRVTLAFDASTLTLLKGPSGSGKTTLLSIVGGLLRPHTGRAVLNGVDMYGGSDVHRAACRRRFFGFVFQSCQLFPTLTALENVRVPLDLRGDTRVAGGSRARALLELVGLGDRAAARPRQLSGGEQQRVAIARALAADPAVVLGDEPTAALDAANGREIAAFLRRAAHELGKTVIVVSHDDRLVEFADRIVQLIDGRVSSDQPRAVA
jgi:putative ABC transport system ATP-binding protein